MKIEGNRSTGDAEAASAADAARKAERSTARPAEQGASGGQDTVQVSADARLLAAALKATTDAAPIRTEVVEAMKQKLAAGEIGADSSALADRIIDDLLDKP